jgi:hypothetical protein
MQSEDPQIVHLDAVSLARYVEGITDSDERARCDAHLADCPECRSELIESRRILATSPRHTQWTRLATAAAAAAVLLLVWTGSVTHHRAEPVTRDAPLTTTIAPLLVAPLGNVSKVDTLRWKAVPGVLRYQVTLFTGEGLVMWRTTTASSFVAPPDTLPLIPATPYYWQVKGETSYGRWVESELVGFTIVPAAPSR